MPLIRTLLATALFWAAPSSSFAQLALQYVNGTTDDQFALALLQLENLRSKGQPAVSDYLEADREEVRRLIAKIQTDGPYTLTGPEEDFCKTVGGALQHFYHLARYCDTLFFFEDIYAICEPELSNRIRVFRFDERWLKPFVSYQLLFHNKLDRASVSRGHINVNNSYTNGSMFNSVEEIEQLCKKAAQFALRPNLTAADIKSFKDENKGISKRLDDLVAGQFRHTNETSSFLTEYRRRRDLEKEFGLPWDAAEEKQRQLTQFRVSARRWTSKDGNFSVTAMYVSFIDGLVILKREDLSTIRVPITKFADRDRVYISRMIREGKRAAPK